MSDFEIVVTGADELIARFRKAPEIVKAEMIKGVDRLTFAGQATSQKEAPVDTGNLRRSITQTKASFAGGSVSGAWGTNVPYAYYAENGRGAGKMPPAGAFPAGFVGTVAARSLSSDVPSVARAPRANTSCKKAACSCSPA